jgi:hypothetical protein
MDTWYVAFVFLVMLGLVGLISAKRGNKKLPQKRKASHGHRRN